MGWGRGCLRGPLHPSSVCTPIPQSPGGEILDSSQAVLCTAARTQVHSTGTPSSHGSDSKWLGCPVGSTWRPSSHPNEDLPAWPHHLECFSESLGGRDMADSCLGVSRPRSLPLGMQSLLHMCACSCVLRIYMYVALQKQPSLWGSWTLHVRVSP